MLHYVELIYPLQDTRSGVPLLALAVIPVDGNIVGVRLRRETSTPFGGDIVYDIRTGVNLAGLVTIFTADANRPTIPFNTLAGEALELAGDLPVAVTQDQTVGFYRLSAVPGGAGYRPTAILVIDDLAPGSVSPATFTTASIADGVETTGTVTMSKAGTILRITADRDARIRLYQTAAARTADAARAFGDMSYRGKAHGMIVDLNLDGSADAPLDFYLAPNAAYSNGDDPRVTDLYYAVVNNSGGTHTVQVDLELVSLA